MWSEFKNVFLSGVLVSVTTLGGSLYYQTVAGAPLPEAVITVTNNPPLTPKQINAKLVEIESSAAAAAKAELAKQRNTIQPSPGITTQSTKTNINHGSSTPIATTTGVKTPAEAAAAAKAKRAADTASLVAQQQLLTQQLTPYQAQQQAQMRSRQSRAS